MDEPLEQGQKLSYHGLKEREDGSFEIIDMTYDPETKSGARFFDTTGDGIEEMVVKAINSLKFSRWWDSRQMIKMVWYNGVIDDPSTFGAITLNAEWNQVVKEILLVEDPEQLLIPEI